MRRSLLLAGVTSALSVVAVMGTSVAASGATTDRGRWAFNETLGGVAVDSSGFGNDGANFDIVGDGAAYTFNGASSRVIVKDDASLDPGVASFSFGATLSMSSPPAVGETYDILRKGVVGTAGGNYKFEVKNVKGKAVARCVVKDSVRVTAAIQSQATVAANLADGRTYTVTCNKTRTGVSVKVEVEGEGLAARTRTVKQLGSVSNNVELAIGAKAGTPLKNGYDWYSGKIYEAWVSAE